MCRGLVYEEFNFFLYHSFFIFVCSRLFFFFFFFKQKTAYEITVRLEFRRVLFRSAHIYNTLGLSTDGTTLTIGSGITVRGQNGYVGYSPYLGGTTNVAVVNQGTIQADVSAGTKIGRASCREREELPKAAEAVTIKH